MRPQDCRSKSAVPISLAASAWSPLVCSRGVANPRHGPSDVTAPPIASNTAAPIAISAGANRHGRGSRRASAHCGMRSPGLASTDPGVGQSVKTCFSTPDGSRALLSAAIVGPSRDQEAVRLPQHQTTREGWRPYYQRPSQWLNAKYAGSANPPPQRSLFEHRPNSQPRSAGFGRSSPRRRGRRRQRPADWPGPTRRRLRDPGAVPGSTGRGQRPRRPR